MYRIVLDTNILISALISKKATPHILVNYSSDPDDNLILGTAIAGEANMLVTGDKKDLLNLKKINNIAILTAKDAVEIMNIGF